LFLTRATSANGAVHLYNPLTQTLVASIYGDTAGDSLGSGGITVLSNNNFVITTPDDDNGGNSNVGSVMLVNGTTGALIESIFGNRAFDYLGSE
jgi:hypothetical protein